MSDAQPRCLLCDAVFADPQESPQQSTRCHECARWIVKSAEEAPLTHGNETAAETIPLLAVRSPTARPMTAAQASDEIPEAVPVVRSKTITSLPARATQNRTSPVSRPGVNSANPPASPATLKPNPVSDRSLPDAERPRPQYALAFGVMLVLLLLSLGAVLLIGYALVKGLQHKKRAEASPLTTVCHSQKGDLCSPLMM